MIQSADPLRAVGVLESSCPPTGGYTSSGGTARWIAHHGKCPPGISRGDPGGVRGGSRGGPGGVPGVGANTPRDHPDAVGAPGAAGADIYILLEPVDLHLAPFGRPFDSNSHPFGSLWLTFPICSSPRGSIF